MARVGKAPNPALHLYAANTISDGRPPSRGEGRRTSGCTGHEPRSTLDWETVAVRLVPVTQVFGGGGRR
jgi:hypothetical protein